ncbi:Leucine-, isoleucine-, valine-, threonine-, and alanine-binding protein [Pseudodesulfovibrio profundus]|uniref:Leucine-, isoleucine-, valine-, threonine-, and alanine-binding protein n=2 Tax=Pseudodesulfovibrio profundus TaxID=57320 RepID=A0A2C8F6G8_9BACT|nr:ABC transporter substrate-binding protein [Pseudodesulfovibrio profundus]MBC16651.1 branched-chain amino acid ABC transporter substrate-binding protein [Desulfovibrio sp.]SOB58328.1 Leucine-, isoleucine-, valine-, threonine-, and alanine-binding protein [Pseudodesulfovibrio profundus]|tara:strand:+ start:80966 stop:82141 length:1176 start_codon:yes stop_codon:yes gene_type:complete
MRKEFSKFGMLTLSLILSALICAPAFAADAIKIGFNLPLTGDIPEVGDGSKKAAEMYLEDINAQGGLEVGGTKYPLEFVYMDNESKAESAVNVALKLIEQEDVIAIIGPNSSKQAVPAGGTCNDNRTPMITPWSTNPDTTKDRPWVFRAAFLDPFQGPVVADFAAKKFGAKKSAVIFDISNDYAKGLAEIFKSSWEKKGLGPVVAFESHGTKDQDFSAQLTTIIAAEPDFIFIPNNYNQVALIVQQARDLGYTGPFMGSDAWGTPDLVKLCGDACYNNYFSTHYAAAGAQGATKEFIDRYEAKYGDTPADYAALTWDSIGILIEAIKNAGKVESNPRKMRKAVREGLAAIKSFDGITGSSKFDAQGDPIKCAVVVKITDKGEFVFEESVCP